MANATCSIDECDKPGRHCGMCAAHYKAKRRAEDPTWNRYSIECATCGQQSWSTRKSGKYCSVTCKAKDHQGQPRAKRVSKLPSDHPVMVLIREAGIERGREAGRRAAQAMRSPLRVAVESQDYDAILRLVLDQCTTAGECRLWARKGRDGYPVLRVGKKEYGVHRLVLEAKHRAPLGSQAAHHTCATPACVNPEHLQPVTHRDNVAEMLARRSYLARIHDLEQALATASPGHPLLSVVEVA